MIRALALFFFCLTGLYIPTEGYGQDQMESPTVFCSLLPLHALSHQVLIAADVYNVKRQRKGGTHQEGWLKGVHAFYRHIGRCRLYWGIEGAYAEGPLHGKTGKGHKLVSGMHDSFVEGQFGYTFQAQCRLRPTFTPFVGIGALWETNKFTKKSPLPVHYQTRFYYASCGALSSFCLFEKWTLGCNVKVRYMWDPKCYVSHDPEHANSHLKVGDEKLQYRIELPIYYHFSSSDSSRWSCACIPFYERRFYGERKAFPFDFIRTQFIECGVTLGIFYSFNTSFSKK